MLVEFLGATFTEIDGVREYSPRGKIFINPDRVNAVYDHCIITGNNQIRVMETIDEIKEKLGMTGLAAIEKHYWKNLEVRDGRP